MPGDEELSRSLQAAADDFELAPAADLEGSRRRGRQRLRRRRTGMGLGAAAMVIAGVAGVASIPRSDDTTVTSVPPGTSTNAVATTATAASSTDSVSPTAPVPDPRPDCPPSSAPAVEFDMAVAATGTFPTPIGDHEWFRLEGTFNENRTRLWETPDGCVLVWDGGSGRVVRSGDFTTFSTEDLPLTDVASLERLDGRFWIRGDADTWYWSDDARSWTEVAVTPPTPPPVTGLDWAVGQQGYDAVTSGDRSLMSFNISGEIPVKDLLSLPDLEPPGVGARTYEEYRLEIQPGDPSPGEPVVVEVLLVVEDEGTLPDDDPRLLPPSPVGSFQLARTGPELIEVLDADGARLSTIEGPSEELDVIHPALISEPLAQVDLSALVLIDAADTRVVRPPWLGGQEHISSDEGFWWWENDEDGLRTLGGWFSPDGVSWSEVEPSGPLAAHSSRVDASGDTMIHVEDEPNLVSFDAGRTWITISSTSGELMPGIGPGGMRLVQYDSSNSRPAENIPGPALAVTGDRGATWAFVSLAPLGIGNPAEGEDGYPVHQDGLRTVVAGPDTVWYLRPAE